MAEVKEPDNIHVKEKDTKEIPQSENDTDSESDVLRAAGIDLTRDNSNEEILTLRMWVLAIGFCIVASGLNTLYTLRKPNITVTSSAILLLAYPLGKLWEKTIPAWNVPLGCWSFNLNPEPFSTKEHTLIYVMSNLSIYVRLGADVLVEQEKFYGYRAGWGFQILVTLSTLLIGFCLAGLFRSIVVVPRELIWPGVLGVTALTTTLHNSHRGEASFDTWKISRYAFFSLVCLGSFCWYWFPDFIFPALSYFNFPCWINPTSPTVNQVFGMNSGMGLIPITFDWSQVSYVGSPLLVPSWAVINILASLVFWIWIVAVACYYTNVWNTGYFPFQSSSVFDNTGQTYKVKKILNSSFKLDMAKYLKYSPVYMPITYALNMFGLSFATLSALLVWVVLEHRHVMAEAVRRVPKIVMESLPGRRKSTGNDETGEPEVPMWWYLVSCVVALFMSIFAVEYWNVGLPWYGVLLACAIALVFFPPLALVYGTANMKINIDIFCRIVAGFVFEGNVLANIWFFDIGYITTIKGLWFAQDMKLAYYAHIPQRKLFLVQCVGMVVGVLSSLGVLNWALHHIPHVCTNSAPNGFSCPFSKTHFNTSLIWGAIGPRRYFNNDIGYSALLYFFIIGAILPIPIHFLSRRYPNSLWKRVHIPLFLGGLNFLPPATGMNYGSWAVVGLIFGWFVRRRLHAWWSKYNFVLSSALDSSVSVAGVLIFLTVFFTGASKHFNWWGTEVYKVCLDILQ
ncbi:uncharacterized protein N7469_003224 [Penicillium citrinum]|uniref:Sexual differentiation process protein isp4 n=1 Tax=Penicillium citrinum TaxID=5077 RepID=A0A9W9PE53_PENCI|nr:uncharacterized protein N7469_003224 [Penicillium citrinum]KAJ5241633.1 hypothetical protein N7469_003224 [Penicillium citrinum]